MLRWMTYGGARAGVKALALVFFAGLPLAGTAETREMRHLLALGDSLTQGYGLIEQEGFVPQLRNWLEEAGYDARVVNGGVSGDTTAGGLARVEWSLTPEIEAMIVTLGGNDLLRGIAPEVARANLEGILQIAQARDIEVLLVAMQAPGNYGPQYKAAFDGMYGELAEAYGADFAPSFFEGLEGDGDTLTDIAPYMQADGIHPNAEGVRKIVAALGPRVAALLDKVE